MRPNPAPGTDAPAAGDPAPGLATYWSLGRPELEAALESRAEGLSKEEAGHRLAVHGPNRLAEDDEASALGLLLRQFASPLVLILIFAAGLSLFTRQWVDAAVILAVVVGSAALSFYQEHNAARAVAALRRRLSLSAHVIRGGEACLVPAETIVPGDLVMLSAGQLVPADGVILEARDFLVSEAALTGESYPAEKEPGPVAIDAPLPKRTNCVFLGTSVRSGTATILVVTTGRGTVFGDLARRVVAREPRTGFAEGLQRFGYLLLRIMIVMVLFVLTMNLLMGRPVLESILFAVALAVGLSPELLPAVVSVTLASGARTMAGQGVIVRRLDAIQNLGALDIFCTDKTGTLTTGEMTVSAVDLEGNSSPEILRLAYLNAAFETGIENPMDQAIVAAGNAAGLTTAGWHKIDEIPYDFLRKRLTIVAAPDQSPERHSLICKGAVREVLGICGSAGPEAGTGLSDGERSRLDEVVRAHSEAGFRVVALAVRDTDGRSRYEHGDEAGLRLLGFLLFHDPPREDAAQLVGDLAALGVKVKVITGDGRHAAAHLATAVGLAGTSMLTGEEIARMTDGALVQRAASAQLFVEVEPQQKERIVRALRARGRIVGYLGDGINDAPALHAADVGISVENAVDVARQTADVVLVRGHLDVLREGIVAGRRTFANTLKYIRITTSANFGNMVTMAVTAPFLPFLPLTAKQILLNNFLSDLPAMAIASDSVDAAETARPERWDIHGIRRFMVIFGLISSAFDLLTFGLLLWVLNATPETFRTAWFLVSLLTEIMIIIVLRTGGPSWKSRPRPVLAAAMLGTALLALALPWLGPPAAIFGFVPLPPLTLVVGLLVTAGYVATTEAAKLAFFRHRNRPARRRHPARQRPL